MPLLPGDAFVDEAASETVAPQDENRCACRITRPTRPFHANCDDKLLHRYDTPHMHHAWERVPPCGRAGPTAGSLHKPCDDPLDRSLCPPLASVSATRSENSARRNSNSARKAAATFGEDGGRRYPA